MKPANPLKIGMMLAILFLPAISYYLISKGKNNFKKLEIFGPREVKSSKNENGNIGADTVYHTIPSFTFTDQYGRTISDKTLEGNFYVADFFFTSCKTICPTMTKQLIRVQEKFKDDGDLKIISFSVDPTTDSVPVLAAYAKQYEARKNQWYYLTGNKDSIYQLARNGYFLAAIQESRGAEEFVHSDQLVLIDKDKRIRGYYDGTDNMEVNKLLDEILVLKWEYKNK